MIIPNCLTSRVGTWYINSKTFRYGNYLGDIGKFTFLLDFGDGKHSNDSYVTCSIMEPKRQTRNEEIPIDPL